MMTACSSSPSGRAGSGGIGLGGASVGGAGGSGPAGGGGGKAAGGQAGGGTAGAEGGRQGIGGGALAGAGGASDVAGNGGGAAGGGAGSPAIGGAAGGAAGSRAAGGAAGGGSGSAAAGGGAGGAGGRSEALSFAPPVRYRGGSWAMMIALGDLNGDGALDVAAADFSNAVGGAFVMLNNGDGTLGVASQYLPGEHKGSIAIGDISGDGHPDLIFMTTQEDLSLLVNNGNGTFPAPSHLPLRALAVQALDVNGDGRVDLAAGSSILVNQGGGAFASPFALTVGGMSMATGDLNRDGKLDIVGGGSSVFVSINRGDGTFVPAVSYGTGNQGEANVAHGLAIGDLNGDGWPDLAAANDSAATVSVLLNKGDGTFVAAHVYPAGPWPTSVAIGDLDGDGRPELVVANSAVGTSASVKGPGYVGVYRNLGNGTFVAPEKILPGMFVESVVLGDLNGDKKLDVVGGDGGGAINVAINLSP